MFLLYSPEIGCREEKKRKEGVRVVWLLDEKTGNQLWMYDCYLALCPSVCVCVMRQTDIFLRSMYRCLSGLRVSSETPRPQAWSAMSLTLQYTLLIRSHWLDCHVYTHLHAWINAYRQAKKLNKCFICSLAIIVTIIKQNIKDEHNYIHQLMFSYVSWFTQ